MKIHLAKADKNDSNINQKFDYPKKEEPHDILDKVDPVLTNNQPIRSSIASEIPLRKFDPKPASPIIPPSVQPSSDDYLSSLNNKLLGFHNKTEHILWKLREILHTPTSLSTDRKIELIKRAWRKLSNNKQKMIEVLMESQFNIHLRSFDINMHSGSMAEGNYMGQNFLRYVKPSIIEALYQKVDMLISCMDLDNQLNQDPPVPLGERLQRNITQFTSATAPLKHRAMDRMYDSHRMARPEYSSMPSDPYLGMMHKKPGYNYPNSDMMSNLNVKMPYSQEMPQNLNNFNGSHSTLNYASGSLNRENKAGYKDLYSNGAPDEHAAYKSRSKYIPTNMNPQMQQYQSTREMMSDGGRVHKDKHLA